MILKFLYVALIVAVVATREQSEDCELKSGECTDHMRTVMERFTLRNKEEICRITKECTTDIKRLCLLSTAEEELMDASLHTISKVCNSSGFLRNNFWILATALLVLIAMKKTHLSTA